MTPERWLRLEELFDAAVELSASDRAAMLDRECADDEVLRQQVESLINSSGQASQFIHAAVHGAARMVAEAKRTPELSREIGPYRVVRELGHGGMGAVYLAVRADDEYQKQVAIKVVRGELQSREMLRRFRSERQILASLDHPGIARLLDGGTTDTGSPYVVMEYVKGEPIDIYCDRNRLTTEERLSLFRKVCGAAHYAHQNLIVHRDIKPSNILVTAEGEPKLLDFGIAKLLSPEPSLQTVAQTRTDMRMMTPDYASPEQVRGEPISTASDIYSLGIVLYELLTGRRPYRFQTYQPLEMERVICEQEPERPSTAVTRDEKAPTTADVAESITATRISERRRSTADRLKRQLRGDLDNIIMKALNKEPSRRYASVEQFSEDIARHLTGLPVIARPDTIGYRARKFVQRHRAGVFATTAVVLLIAGLIGFYTWQLAGERDRAQLEAAKATQVSGFLSGLFEVSDPSQSRGETITARELLDRGAARIERELSGQPEVQAEMMTVVGRVYRELGLYNKAKPLLVAARDIRLQVHGAEHRRVAESLHELSMVDLALGNYDAAEALAREALAMSNKVVGDEHPDFARDLQGMTTILNTKGNFDEAETAAERSLAVYRRTVAEDDPRIASALSGLASIRRRKGNYDEAEALLLQVLTLYRNRFGDQDPRIAEVLHDLGDLQNDKGGYGAAVPYFRQALDIGQKTLGEEHPLIPKILTGKGLALAGVGEYGAAEAHLQEALSRNIKLGGEETLYVANSRQNLATVLHRLGKLEEAEPLYRRALEIYQKIFGEEDPRAATTLTMLGSLLLERGNPRDAEKSIRQALAIDRKIYGDEHPYIADDLGRLGRVLEEKRDYEAAETVYLQSIELQRRILDKNDPNRAAPLIGFGSLLVKKGEPQRSEPLLREALDVLQEALPAGDWTIANAKSELAECLIVMQRYDEAEAMLLESYAILKSVRGESNERTERALARIVKLYQAWGKNDQATTYRAMQKNITSP